MSSSAPPIRPLRVAALVDLVRSPQAGGHVKCWERLAAAAALAADALDLTVFFSGDAPDEALAPNVRFRHLQPVFSTARLKFLPDMPGHSDLAPFHPLLARELRGYDLIHTTDAYFAFARTAERIARRRGAPLTTSFHTDTPVYSRLFTRQTIESLCARWPRLARGLIERWRLPEREEARMESRLRRHLSRCAYAFVARAQDESVAQMILGRGRVGTLRVGVDKAVFGPHRRDVVGVRRDYSIPDGGVVALSVGRLDIGKNASLLGEAVALAINIGAPLHLIVAGAGPLAADLAQRLGGRVRLPGFVPPGELARLYASADFLALPSEVEIHSMATIEAIAAGCPALIARAAGSAPLFTDATAAVMPVEGGAEQWAAAMRALAADPQRRGTMRRAALAYAGKRVASWSEVLLKDLLPGWRAARPDRVADGE